MPQPSKDDTDLSAKLDAILFHLQRMDARDRLRTWGGFARSLIAIVPLLFFLWASWYIATHADEFIKKISEESAKAAAKYTQDQSSELMQKVQNLIPKR